jgi:hypothetical protein
MNHHGYTDVTPYEVVRVISETTVEIRQMDSELEPDSKPEFIVGGVAGHCTNQHSLRYRLTSNPANRVIRIRKSKKGWAKGTFRPSDKPIRFYDYNF